MMKIFIPLALSVAIAMPATAMCPPTEEWLPGTCVCVNLDGSIPDAGVACEVSEFYAPGSDQLLLVSAFTWKES